MAHAKADLVIHPARLRILQELSRGALTTQEIANNLPSVPKSSIYRHLKLLLEGEMVEVVETRLVNGIQEKVYGMLAPPILSEEDLAHTSPEDHLRYFTTFVATILRGFADYIGSSLDTAAIPLAEDRVGYQETLFYATQEEMDSFATNLNKAFEPLLANKPGKERIKRKLVTITHPIKEESRVDD